MSQSEETKQAVARTQATSKHEPDQDQGDGLEPKKDRAFASHTRELFKKSKAAFY
jgi:hypothetical protein